MIQFSHYAVMSVGDKGGSAIATSLLNAYRIPWVFSSLFHLRVNILSQIRGHKYTRGDFSCFVHPSTFRSIQQHNVYTYVSITNLEKDHPEPHGVDRQKSETRKNTKHTTDQKGGRQT